MSASDLSFYLAIAAWTIGNTAVVLALFGCFARRDNDGFFYAMVVLALAFLANAGIVRLFI